MVGLHQEGSASAACAAGLFLPIDEKSKCDVNLKMFAYFYLIYDQYICSGSIQ